MTLFFFVVEYVDCVWWHYG